MPPPTPQHQTHDDAFCSAGITTKSVDVDTPAVPQSPADQHDQQEPAVRSDEEEQEHNEVFSEICDDGATIKIEARNDVVRSLKNVCSARRVALGRQRSGSCSGRTGRRSLPSAARRWQLLQQSLAVAATARMMRPEQPSSRAAGRPRRLPRPRVSVASASPPWWPAVSSSSRPLVLPPLAG